MTITAEHTAPKNQNPPPIASPIPAVAQIPEAVVSPLSQPQKTPPPRR